VRLPPEWVQDELLYDIFWKSRRHNAARLWRVRITFDNPQHCDWDELDTWEDTGADALTSNSRPASDDCRRQWEKRTFTDNLHSSAKAIEIPLSHDEGAKSRAGIPQFQKHRSERRHMFVLRALG